jgi:hypothetical protein
MANLTDKNILFIVEGDRTEPTLIRMVNKNFGFIDEHKVFSYKTTIHKLYDDLILDEYLQINLLLSEKTTVQNEKKILSMHFIAIYLVFDFDPHHPKYNLEHLIEMVSVFNDPLDRGLLLINYPMVEAHRHHGIMPDHSFFDKTVTKDEIRRYKELVGIESSYTAINKYHRGIIINQLAHHLVKMNYLIYNEKSIPEVTKMYDLISNVEFINKQDENYRNDKLFVLSTVFFYLIDLKPKSFYDEVKTYELMFLNND